VNERAVAEASEVTCIYTYTIHSMKQRIIDSKYPSVSSVHVQTRNYKKGLRDKV